jgi:hypothetical protein
MYEEQSYLDDEIDFDAILGFDESLLRTADDSISTASSILYDKTIDKAGRTPHPKMHQAGLNKEALLKVLACPERKPSNYLITPKLDKQVQQQFSFANISSSMILPGNSDFGTSQFASAATTPQVVVQQEAVHDHSNAFVSSSQLWLNGQHKPVPPTTQGAAPPLLDSYDEYDNETENSSSGGCGSGTDDGDKAERLLLGINNESFGTTASDGIAASAPSLLLQPSTVITTARGRPGATPAVFRMPRRSTLDTHKNSNNNILLYARRDGGALEKSKKSTKTLSTAKQFAGKENDDTAIAKTVVVKDTSLRRYMAESQARSTAFVPTPTIVIDTPVSAVTIPTTATVTATATATTICNSDSSSCISGISSTNNNSTSAWTPFVTSNVSSSRALDSSFAAVGTVPTAVPASVAVTTSASQAEMLMPSPISMNNDSPSALCAALALSPDNDNESLPPTVRQQSTTPVVSQTANANGNNIHIYGSNISGNICSTVGGTVDDIRVEIGSHAAPIRRGTTTTVSFNGLALPAPNNAPPDFAPIEAMIDTTTVTSASAVATAPPLTTASSVATASARPLSVGELQPEQQFHSSVSISEGGVYRGRGPIMTCNQGNRIVKTHRSTNVNVSTVPIALVATASAVTSALPAVVQSQQNTNTLHLYKDWNTPRKTRKTLQSVAALQPPNDQHQQTTSAETATEPLLLVESSSSCEAAAIAAADVSCQVDSAFFAREKTTPTTVVAPPSRTSVVKEQVDCAVQSSFLWSPLQPPQQQNCNIPVNNNNSDERSYCLEDLLPSYLSQSMIHSPLVASYASTPTRSPIASATAMADISPLTIDQDHGHNHSNAYHYPFVKPILSNSIPNSDRKKVKKTISFDTQACLSEKKKEKTTTTMTNHKKSITTVASAQRPPLPTVPSAVSAVSPMSVSSLGGASRVLVQDRARYEREQWREQTTPHRNKDQYHYQEKVDKEEEEDEEDRWGDRDLTMLTDIAVASFTEAMLVERDNEFNGATDMDGYCNDVDEDQSIANTTFTVDSPGSALSFSSPSQQQRNNMPVLAIKSLKREKDSPLSVKEIDFCTAPGEFTTVMLSLHNHRKKDLVLLSDCVFLRVEPLYKARFTGEGLNQEQLQQQQTETTAASKQEVFSVSPASLRVAPHEQAVLFVTFSPEAGKEGIFSGAMRIRCGKKVPLQSL